jgi:hypothetical protein
VKLPDKLHDLKGSYLSTTFTNTAPARLWQTKVLGVSAVTAITSRTTRARARVEPCFVASAVWHGCKEHGRAKQSSVCSYIRRGREGGGKATHCNEGAPTQRSVPRVLPKNTGSSSIYAHQHDHVYIHTYIHCTFRAGRFNRDALFLRFGRSRVRS